MPRLVGIKITLSAVPSGSLKVIMKHKPCCMTGPRSLFFANDKNFECVVLCDDNSV